MKKTFVFFIYMFFLGICQLVSAQDYQVYDGDDFSVMFKTNSDNTSATEAKFSAKDSNGEWQWYNFEIYDSIDYLDSEFEGFTFYCTDIGGNEYEVDYYMDEDYLIVYAINADGSLGTEWDLEPRTE
jgi:hypothetical protein